MALTATGDASARDRFDLDAEDEANSIVRQRLDAAKSNRVRSVARCGGQTWPTPQTLTASWSTSVRNKTNQVGETSDVSTTAAMLAGNWKASSPRPVAASGSCLEILPVASWLLHHPSTGPERQRPISTWLTWPRRTPPDSGGTLRAGRMVQLKLLVGSILNTLASLPPGQWRELGG